MLPAGVINIVTGRGSVVGQAILDHPDVDKVAFTGSTSVGYTVAAAAAKKLIPATLELGGKSANIVFPDANMEKAVKYAAIAILMNQGQACESGSRLFLHKDIHDEFLKKLKVRFESVKVGDPMAKDTQMGSQVSQGQLDTILSYVELAKKEGATVSIPEKSPIHFQRSSSILICILRRSLCVKPDLLNIRLSPF